MRCSVCDSKTGCEHIKASTYIEPEIVVKPVSIPEQEAKYVPGVRSSEVVSGTAGAKVVTREGARGERGERGFTGERGPEGRPGRDADVGVAVAAGQQAARDEFNRLKGELSASIVAELQRVGALDTNGKFILREGPKGRDGRDGKDSVVPGPKGDPGKDGRDGKDSVVPGPKGDPGKDGRDGKDSVVPGPKGDPGRDGRDGADGKNGVGHEGPPGNIDAAVRNCQKMLDDRLAQFKEEILNEFRKS